MTYKRLADVKSVSTSHGYGEKCVFLKNDETLSNLTQVAVGIITKNDKIAPHCHPTMEEYYYFLEGNSTFIINDEIIECSPNVFVQVPSDTLHSLSTDNSVKFLYWGIAL